ncbi:Phosphatidate cytidylyltransferase|uniref:phosphatidate cytidylyltransferase n=1 Tax=Neochlamydia sp. AcF84 TaxID=2315858 RepID=UPI001408C36E|nr:phosphatidate cytidylyltransferase [Neochlamydia sp. AcF84]NGY95149.1 Phosphatidate cytidylyltransferase [Neochlamydia sp. AcF84]
MSNLQHRLLLGSMTTLFAILLLWFSPYLFFRPIFALILATFVTLAAAELFHLAKSKNYQPLTKIGLVGCFLYTLSVYVSTQYGQAQILPYIVLILIVWICFFYFFKTGDKPLLNISITLLALMYVAIPLASWLNIAYFFPEHSPQEGRWWLIYLLAVTKTTDIGAYFVGSLLGKHKMAPYLSPKKSNEGAVGGLCCGLGASFTFYWISAHIPFQITLFQSLALGILLSTMGQIGDLAESLLKRDADIKNSNQIPGLGGILDMLDSLVFTSPIVYIFLEIQSASS